VDVFTSYKTIHSFASAVNSTFDIKIRHLVRKPGHGSVPDRMGEGRFRRQSGKETTGRGAAPQKVEKNGR